MDRPLTAGALALAALLPGSGLAYRPPVTDEALCASDAVLLVEVQSRESAPHTIGGFGTVRSVAQARVHHVVHGTAEAGSMVSLRTLGGELSLPDGRTAAVEVSEFPALAPHSWYLLHLRARADADWPSFVAFQRFDPEAVPTAAALDAEWREACGA